MSGAQTLWCSVAIPSACGYLEITRVTQANIYRMAPVCQMCPAGALWQERCISCMDEPAACLFFPISSLRPDAVPSDHIRLHVENPVLMTKCEMLQSSI